jgi:hypothetical protein
MMREYIGRFVNALFRATSSHNLLFYRVRIYLGVGADDLKVYLDVLGGALKKGGSMIGPA